MRSVRGRGRSAWGRCCRMLLVFLWWSWFSAAPSPPAQAPCCHLGAWWRDTAGGGLSPDSGDGEDTDTVPGRVGPVHCHLFCWWEDQKDAKCFKFKLFLQIRIVISGWKIVTFFLLTHNNEMSAFQLRLKSSWLHVEFVIQAKLWLLCVIWEHYEDIRSGAILQTRHPVRPGKWWESQVFQEIFCFIWIMNHAAGN